MSIIQFIFILLQFLLLILTCKSVNYIASIKPFFTKQYRIIDEEFNILISEYFDWSHSSCNHAINLKLLHDIHKSYYIKLTFQYNDNELEFLQQNHQLHIINIGSSKTATTFIYNQYIKMNLNSLHNEDITLSKMNPIQVYDTHTSSNYIYTTFHMNTKYMTLFNSTHSFELYILKCLNSESMKCSISEIMNNLKVILMNFIVSFDGISDTLMDAFFPEIYNLNPNMKVILSLRDPYEWSKERLNHSKINIMCNPNIWSNPYIRHPFDFLRCLDYGFKNHKPISEIFIHMNMLKHLCKIYNIDIYGVLAYAFIRQNSVNIMLYYHFNGKNNTNFLPICMFDLKTRDTLQYEQLINNFYNNWNDE